MAPPPIMTCGVWLRSCFSVSIFRVSKACMGVMAANVGGVVSVAKGCAEGVTGMSWRWHVRARMTIILPAMKSSGRQRRAVSPG